MIRTIISLHPNEKHWLDQVAKRQHISMAKIIRQAIREYQKNHSHLIQSKFDKLLEKTKGVWQKGDGLQYQTKLRDEWDRKK